MMVHDGQALSSDWDRLHKASIWDGHGSAATFDMAYSETDGSHIKVKVHKRAVENKDLPNDVVGWHLFASRDEDVDESIGQRRITNDYTKGVHRVFEIPTDTALMTPP